MTATDRAKALLTLPIKDACPHGFFRRVHCLTCLAEAFGDHEQQTLERARTVAAARGCAWKEQRRGAGGRTIGAREDEAFLIGEEIGNLVEHIK